MKDEISLARSADHCLKRALEEIENVKRDLVRLRGGQPLKNIMPRLRLQAHEVEKQIHEFNAYRDALYTK